MKKLVFLTLIALIFPLLFPIGENFHMVKKYTYASEGQTHALNFKEINEPTVSLNSGLKSVAFWKQATGIANFVSKQNMFTIKIPRTFDIGAGDSPLRVSIQVDSKIFPLSIDMDGDGRDEDFYYTEPLFLDKTSHVSYVIETKSGIQIPEVSIIGLDTDAANLHIAFGGNTAEAAVGSTLPNIIKRADW